MNNLRKIVLFLIIFVAACTPQSDDPVLEIPPTATLLPVVSQTQRVTETPVPTRTPLPTFTYTPTLTSVPPTETLSPTPTLTPTVSGIVASMQAVNVREGPDISFNVLTSINPGTGVIIIGQNPEGTWLNVRLEDGREGWMLLRLVRIEPTATPFPTFTATADLTSIALGTTFPTAVIGGGSVTPTPPPQVVTGTAELSVASIENDAATSATGLVQGVPVVGNEAIQQTADALRGIVLPTQAPAGSGRVITVVPNSASGTVAAITPPTAGASSIAPVTDSNTPIDGRDVFAFCDNPIHQIPKPPILNAGDRIDIWWAWVASTEQHVRDHIEVATIELRVNGTQLPMLPTYRTPIRQQQGLYAVYWYVPYGPLPPGEYEITYVVTWQEAITDGLGGNFGPRTETPFEQETCSFTVR